MIIAWTLEEQRLKEEAERIKCEHESLEPFYKAKKEGMEQTENETSQKSEVSKIATNSYCIYLITCSLHLLAYIFYLKCRTPQKHRDDSNNTHDVRMINLNFVQWYRYLYSTMLPYATDEGSVHSFLDVMAASFDTSLSSAIATSMNIHRV